MPGPAAPAAQAGAAPPDGGFRNSRLAAAVRERRALLEALEAHERTLGAEHPDTLASVNKLAELLQDQGKLAEAESMHRRAFKEHYGI